MKYKALIFFYLSFIGFIMAEQDISAQLSLDKLDFNRIRQKKIIEFVRTQKRNGKKTFYELNSFCYRKQDSIKFSQISSTYLIREKAEKVWDGYLRMCPFEAYSGNRVGFGFIYSKKDDKIIYSGDIYDKLEVGQQYFFNIRVLGGIKNMGVADEVTGLDESTKTIRFCYLQYGKTEGTQEISLKETPDGYTQVTHKSWYHSSSKFRDRVLYPYFHNLTIGEYHQIVKKMLENPKSLIFLNIE